MTLCVVLLLEVPAAHSPIAAQLTPEWLREAAVSLQAQLQWDVAPVWPYAKDATVRVGSGPDDLGPGEIPARILATLPEAPGAIAYHDVDSDAPDVFLGLDDCQTPDDVTSALSHEFCETSADPDCNLWVTVPDGIPLPDGLVAGQQIAQENADPLQDRSYPINGFAMSDFCYPAYFGTAPGPTSYGEAKGGPRLEPFDHTPLGYLLVRNGDGRGETQLTGKMHAARQKRARMVGSRPSRRGWRAG